METHEYRPPKKRAKPVDLEAFCLKYYEKHGFVGAKTTNWTAYGKHDWMGIADLIVFSPVGQGHIIQVTDTKHLKEHLQKYATKHLLVDRIKKLVARNVPVELFICKKGEDGKPILVEQYRYTGGLFPVRMHE